MTFKCGFVTLIGRPNAGKSTLLNQILGGKLAITSHKPQTTRDRIAGVLTNEEMQLILLDTPGVHDAWTELNKAMVRRAEEALAEGDVVAWLLDVSEVPARLKKGRELLTEDDKALASLVRASGRPVIVVLNKLDLVHPEILLPLMDTLKDVVTMSAAIPVSALKGDGVPDLLARIQGHLPEGPALYPEDYWTDRTERFLASEVIREKIFHLTEQEIPYASLVQIEKFDESKREPHTDDKGRAHKGIVHIGAVVVVERQQQKGIIIGKKGAMIKKIGTLSRKELEGILGCKVHLELFVKVEANWSKTPKGLRRVGFGD